MPERPFVQAPGRRSLLEQLLAVGPPSQGSGEPLCSMSSKPEQKETHQGNGAVLPIVPMDCLTSPDRGQLDPPDFRGPNGDGVEVVVLESHANAKGVREEDALLENGSQSNESDDTSTDRGPEPASPLKETSFSIGLQVLFPFLLAGFGTVAAGMVLDIVQVINVTAGTAALVLDFRQQISCCCFDAQPKTVTEAQNPIICVAEVYEAIWMEEAALLELRSTKNAPLEAPLFA